MYVILYLSLSYLSLCIFSFSYLFFLSRMLAVSLFLFTCIFLNYSKYFPISLMIANYPQANKIRESKMKRERESQILRRILKGVLGASAMKVLAIDLARSSVVRDWTCRYVKLITWPGGSGSAFVSNDLQVYRRHALRTITQSIWV